MKKSTILIIIGIVSFIILAVGGFFVFKHIKDNKNTQTTETTKGTSSSEINLNNESYEITKGGIYKFTGSIKDGSIITNTDDEVKIVLNSVEINNDSGPCIYIKGNGNTKIELVGENKLTGGSSYTDTELDGVIYSKADLTILGDGSLEVTSNYEDGIVTKDDLEIKGGTIIVTSADDGIKGKDSVTVEKSNITVNAGGSGIKSTNDEDYEKGYITINSGSFTINAVDNGIKSITKLTINGGEFNIRAEECLESTYIIINDGTMALSSSDDGINASVKSDFMSPTIEINGGNITINMDQGDTDALDSNGYLYINGGTININAQSPFDWDIEGKLNGGTVIVNGETVTELSNQFAGGQGGPGGGMGPEPR